MNRLNLFLIAGTFLLATSAQAAEYKIDPAHSSLGFAVKHLMVSTVRGDFNTFSGTVTLDKNDLSTFNADVTIDAKSIDTGNADRDKHLANADFLDTDKFPSITFTSNKITQTGETYEITGDLTMHGVTKQVTIPVEVTGPVQSPFGGEVIGLSGTFSIDRQDYGVSWNKQLDNGGWVVDNRVIISVDLEAGHKPEAAAPEAADK